jgi:hypothetical protein
VLWCVFAHTYTCACGCMCVWRAGQAGGHLRVRRHDVKRVYLCVYGMPLVLRVVYMPTYKCVYVCDCVCMWIWLV